MVFSRIPWFRRDFLMRRRLDRLFLDGPDWVVRSLSGRGHWPPYSLRAFVGGAERFDEVGQWFLQELLSLGLLAPDVRILDVGCGCGRLAYPIAVDQRMKDWQVTYWGMEIDRRSVAWCQRHITPLNPRFKFYHADCRNPSYNPKGTIATTDYRFPHEDGLFQLILLTSVFTHILEPDCRHYLGEIARLLAPGGLAYASFFLYQTPEEAHGAEGRHGIAFPFQRGHCFVNREDFPTNAVAYHEPFLRECIGQAGLRISEPVRYGVQDALLLRRPEAG